jgi:hypothetical protein
MLVTEGHFDGVDLAGTKWAAIVHWPKALHDGNGTLEALIDEGASDEQRNALGQILTGQVGGPFFEIVATIVTTCTARTSFRSTSSSTRTAAARGCRHQALSRPRAFR